MKNRNKNSIIFFFIRQFLLILLIFTILFFVLFGFLVFHTQKMIFRNVQEMITLTEFRTQSNLNRDMYQLLETSSTDSSFPRLGLAERSSDRYFYISKVATILKSLCTGVSAIDGCFVYYPSSDVFVSTNKDSLRTDYAAITQQIRQNLSEGCFPNEMPLNVLPQKMWFFLEAAANTEGFFLRIIKSGSLYLGAWITEDHLKEQCVPTLEDIYVAFTDDSGAVISSARTPGEQLPVGESDESPRVIRSKGFGRELLISKKMHYSNYYLAVMLPYSYVTNSLQGSIIFFILVLLWFSSLTFITIRLVRKVLKLPVSSLEPVMEDIKKGQYDVQLVSPSRFSEIEDITDAFNTMISEIRNLKNNVYEEQLIHRDLEMKYLKNQIAPHFLINCLNSVFVSSQDAANRETTDTIIQTLSEHIRYTLSNVSTVSLKTELYYLVNYLRLTQCRFPDTLQFTLDVEEEAKTAEVFPLILLTLTENSIKTGLIMGEPFLIEVSGRIYEAEGKKRVRLVHTDSGSGVSEEKLELFNHIIDHPEVTDKGTGIGLYNTAMRLRMILGDETSMAFTNAPGKGLQITIDFPYREIINDVLEREAVS